MNEKITCYESVKTRPKEESEIEYVNDLSKLYARFDWHGFKEEQRALWSTWNEKVSGENIALWISEEGFTKCMFCDIKENKSCGPDRINGKLFKLAFINS